MPELPDLQVIGSNLQKRFANKSLRQLLVHKDSKLNASSQQLKEAFESHYLMHISRDGKELKLHFSNGQILGLHLMLKGEIYEIPYEKEKGKIIEFVFEDQSGFVVTDFMGQAKAILNPPIPSAPDALSYALTADYLIRQCKAKKGTPIKTLLMDQYVLRGIGNAYADEILWQCRISPFSSCDKIPETQIHALLNAIQNVLQQAEQNIRTLQPDIISGELRSFLDIHNPKKTISPAGGAILCKELNKRKTYYTEEQVLYS